MLSRLEATPTMDQADTRAAPVSRLLVAGSDPELRALAVRLLGPFGTVELVPDAVAALEATRTRLPDLLLLDLRTAGPGWAALLREDDRARDLRVVVVAERDGSFPADVEAIADDFVLRPLAGPELVARVRTQLLVASQRAALRTAEAEIAHTEAALARSEAALARSEERFRTTVESVPINIALYSHDHRLLYLNPTLAAMCPRPVSELLGLRADELGQGPVPETLIRHIDRAVATGERQNYELVAAEVPGGPRVVKEWTVVPLAGQAGEAPSYLVMTHDITAQRQLVEELRESNRRKSEFIAVLSHELRNPLAAIRTNLYVSERAPGTDTGSRALRVIDRQVGQLVRMVDDLLDISRITQNKIQLRLRRVDLVELVRQTIEDNRTTLEQSGVQLEARFAGGPLLVNADAARIAQVVTNLLANAVKFTPAGGTVAVSVSSEELGGGRAVLEVKDTGTGIDPGLLGKLFVPFMQADRTLDRTSGGLGLGLALVKGLVDLHGGEVSAHSDGLGQGAEFVVHLPLASQAATGARSGAGETGPGARRRVLVIEDDLDVADGLQSALAIDEHNVVVARSGPEGLERARAFAPDVVLCDIGLPGMSGYDVARAFRADDALRSTFLVALSGYAQAEDVDRARAAGFDEHVAKPPAIDRLQRIFGAGGRSGR
jgi:PAS domain S-box-containing protein